MNKNQFNREAKEFNRKGRCLIHAEYKADVPFHSFACASGDYDVIEYALAHIIENLAKSTKKTNGAVMFEIDDILRTRKEIENDSN